MIACARRSDNARPERRNDCVREQLEKTAIAQWLQLKSLSEGVDRTLAHTRAETSPHARGRTRDDASDCGRAVQSEGRLRQDDHDPQPGRAPRSEREEDPPRRF